jgi:hypothetical protein
VAYEAASQANEKGGILPKIIPNFQRIRASLWGLRTWVKGP